MDIIIRLGGGENPTVFDAVERDFKAAFPETDCVWFRSGENMQTTAEVDSDALKTFFESIVARYEGLDVTAERTYEVDKEDTNEQWWGSERLYSAWENGKTVIHRNNGMYWF